MNKSTFFSCFLIINLFWLFSCKTVKPVFIEKEIRDSIYLVDTIVKVHLKPFYKETITNDTISYIDSDYSSSEARISNNKLYHNLTNKDKKIPVEVKYIYRDREVKVPTPYEVEKIVKVERQLSWWQKKKIQLGEVFIVVILVIGGGFIYKRFG